MSAPTRPPNADMEAVQEVLRAATRGPRDPDLELAITLSELSDSEEPTAVEAALVRLARRARSNSG